jgi:hypothetical protein
MTEDAIEQLATELRGQLVEMEARVASGEVTDPGIMALARHLRATFDWSERLMAEYAREHGTA